MSIEGELKGLASALADELRERGAGDCTLALVLGSGLGGFADGLTNPLEIPGEELEHLPKSAVLGHAGRIVVGELAGVRLLVQMGRVHLYEGWSAHEVTRAVRTFAELGVGGLVLTNAAGSTREEWGPGTLMRIADHLNLQARAPLYAGERALGRAYDPEFGRALERAAESAEVALESGVYAAMLGPTYETPAEVRMARELGADAVGMSTVCEAAAARAAGLRVAAVSCLTNHAAGITTEKLEHEDVVAVGRSASDSLIRLFEHAVPELARVLGA